MFKQEWEAGSPSLQVLGSGYVLPELLIFCVIRSLSPWPMVLARVFSALQLSLLNACIPPLSPGCFLTFSQNLLCL